MEKDEILFLMKFGTKEHLEELQKGHFYTKNLEYYIKCENQGGQGDENEAALILNKAKVEARDPKTNEIIFVCNPGKVTLRNTRDQYVPVFCMYYIDSDDLEDIKVENGIKTAKFKFRKDKIDYFKKEFGEYVLIISPVDFCNKIIDNFSDKTRVTFKKVKYENLSINSSERLKAFSKDSINRFFVKDNSFKCQKEYRIVFEDIKVKNSLEKDIGDIKKYSHLFSIDELAKNKLIIQYSSIDFKNS